MHLQLLCLCLLLVVLHWHWCTWSSHLYIRLIWRVGIVQDLHALWNCSHVEFFSVKCAVVCQELICLFLCSPAVNVEILSPVIGSALSLIEGLSFVFSWTVWPKREVRTNMVWGEVCRYTCGAVHQGAWLSLQAEETDVSLINKLNMRATSREHTDRRTLHIIHDWSWLLMSETELWLNELALTLTHTRLHMNSNVSHFKRKLQI